MVDILAGSFAARLDRRLPSRGPVAPAIHDRRSLSPRRGVVRPPSQGRLVGPLDWPLLPALPSDRRWPFPDCEIVVHHPAQPTPLPRTALPEHARPVSDLIERVLKQRPQARVDVVIRLVRATLAHPAWERLPADEAAARAERIVLGQLARLPSPRTDDDRPSEANAVAGGARTSVDVTDRRHPVSR